MLARAKIIVRGMVQGIGFRYFAYRKATELGLVGFVRNLPDGSVESEVEGLKGLIHQYLRALKVGPTLSHVTNVTIEWLPLTHQYTEFRITY